MKVNDDTILNGVKIGDIRKNGVISLSEMHHGRILMPLVLLRVINHFHLHLVDDKHINPLNLSTPQSLEKLLSISMLLQINLLNDLGENSTTYKEIAPGI
jgi:hypothetical protein